MPRAEFSLQERDKIRLFKDRTARVVVSAGGVGVLLALLLIFFYLLSIVLPMFEGATIERRGQLTYHSASPLLAMGIDNYGDNAYLFEQSGALTYLAIDPALSGDAPVQSLLATQVLDQPAAFAVSSSSGWYAYGNRLGEVVAVKPEYVVSFKQSGRVSTPNLKALLDGELLQLDPDRGAIARLTLAVTAERALFVAMTEQGATRAMAVKLQPDSSGQPQQRSLVIPQLPVSVSKLLLSPDGSQLFALDGETLIVLMQKAQGFVVRELVDLTQGEAARRVSGISLLAGAQSLLVQYNDGLVSQWFDVLQQGQRQLTYIRDFQPAADLQQVLPHSYRKGFFTLHGSGKLQGYHTTSENLTFSGQVLDQAPQLAAISANEQFMLTGYDDTFTLFRVENEHPEISLKSLWQKVWYENYPEPAFVWQSTAALDDYEAKLSLVPITFGTIKAALFCMLFSVPIGVMGAIYTAYFMTPAVRQVVKPAIELMEALPTVIIGFLAGMWLAPIVESHLPSVMALMVCVPLAVLLVGWLWSALPKSLLNRMPNGWHLGVLIPLLLMVFTSVLSYSGEIERTLFAGDIRLFLADYGIDFDQRNALVIGLAMGFAVVPTIFTIAEDAVFSVPKHLSDGSLALGATQWQTLTRVVLLTASPGIFSAIMIGLGRAVGETMIVLMATGNTPLLDWNMLEGMRTLSATIAVEMPESDVGSSHYRLLFLAALILFIFTFMLNSLAEVVRQRLRDKYSSM